LIHRDIKPANLFMCRLGPDDDFVKVLDFGLVKHADASNAHSMLTLEGVTAGTPGFMAPEIALGKPGIDGRSDLYSLGCVAYYLLTGQHVFSGDTAVATVLAHVQTPPTPPSARAEFPIPPALDATILACLAKEPSDRPASAWVLDRRLAAAVSADESWTPEAARAWWDLRRVVVDPAERAVVKTAPEGEAAPAMKRCWPKFSTPMSDAAAAGRRGAR
jgi:serine/threonine-protein kinase